MYKSIKSLTWNVSEEEYRNDDAISYSMLASFEREGFKIIPHLKDKKSSEALRFGSLVDTILTEPEELDNKFLVSDISKVTEIILNIIKNVYENCDKTTNNLTEINRDLILNSIKEFNYQSNWKDDTRINKVIEEGSSYFSLLGLAGNKTLISQYEYDLAVSCVESIKNSEFTNKYFNDTVDYFGEIEAFYQLKLKYNKNGLNVRCMFDRVIVNHKTKTIQPIDLKTTGKDEEEFENSFLAWSYWIQSNMYSEILKLIIEEDDYFKDFTILPFLFVVVNKNNKTPLVWCDVNNLEKGDRIDKYNNVHKYWIDLYKDLKWHIDNEEYKYSLESIQNNGVRILNNIKIKKDE